MTFVSLAAFAVLTQPVAKAEPGSHSANASVIVAPSCSMTTTTVTPHTATILNGNRTINIGKTTLEAFCNDTGGFAIYAAGYTGNIYSDNRLVSPNSTSTPDVINSGNTATGNTSSWGVKASVTQGTTYPAVIASDFVSAENDGYVEIPDELALLASRNSVTSKSAGSGLDITYGAYVSPSQAAGTYTGQVIYVMVHPANASTPGGIPGSFDAAFANASKTKVGNYYAMQDMTSAICAEVDEGQETQLIDIRDNTVYRVGKLADGNCWLKDSLALDLTNSTILNGLDANNTNADATALGYLKGTTTRDPSTDPNGNYATAGVANWTNSYSYSAPLVNMASKDVVPQGSNDPLAAETLAGSWQVGGYYNYCAASAGSYCYGDSASQGSPSGNASSDICPSGWRMPTGGASGEYQLLTNAIAGGTSDTINTEPEYSNIRKALSLPLSGFFYYGSARSQGSYGYFWSSTYVSSSNMYCLGVFASVVRPQGGHGRYYGNSVRCVAQ